MPTTTIRSFAWELIIASTAAGALWGAVGNTLGLWLGGLALGAILAPAFAVRRAGWVDRVLAAGSAADPVAAVWLASALLTQVPAWSWFSCAILLYAVCAASAAVAVLVASSRAPRFIGSAVAVILLLAWMAYPLWGGRSIDRGVAGVLSDYHPLIAANGQLSSRLGVWLERPIAYRLTVLGQDVPYGLPATVWPSATLHLLIAALAAGAARAIETVASPRRWPASSPDPPDPPASG